MRERCGGLAKRNPSADTRRTTVQGLSLLSELPNASSGSLGDT